MEIAYITVELSSWYSSIADAPRVSPRRSRMTPAFCVNPAHDQGAFQNLIAIGA
jgi:hypothetical protein